MPTIISDPWGHLRAYTQARIAQGRAGHSLPTDQLLQFQADHALARDAVYSSLAISDLHQQLSQLLETVKAPTNTVLTVQSQAQNRSQYLQRPDWGRKLAAQSRQQLCETAWPPSKISMVIADGLSASAVNAHALPVLRQLIPALLSLGWNLAPLTLVEQGRVAIADEIGHLLHAEMVVMLIGERPGLSSPDSMGAYLTYAPHPGLTDESRNCVSNIRPEGLGYEAAARKLLYLLTEMHHKKLSGVLLKDEMDSLSSSSDLPSIN
ncbi:MAG: ethanolamine ammonia-lyase subunit EutC [Spirosomataceae bacterium]